MIPPKANSAFVAAMEDVLAVYTRPRDGDCPLVCLDETSKQLIAETRVPIPMKAGRTARARRATTTRRWASPRARELARYFPQEITRRYPEAVGTHRLRREIIATQLANSMINRGGPMLVVRIADQTGVSADRIAAAFAAVRDSYDMIAVNTAIEALDNQIAGDVQLGLLAVVQNLLHDRMVWVLRNLDLSGGLAGLVDHYRAGIARVAAALDRILSRRGGRGGGA